MNEGMALRVADDTLTVIFSQESASRERVVISIVNGSRPQSYVVFKNIRCGANGTVEYDERFNTSAVQSALERGGAVACRRMRMNSLNDIGKKYKEG